MGDGVLIYFGWPETPPYSGFPLGVNDLAIAPDGKSIYAVTDGDPMVVKVPIKADGTAGKATVVARGFSPFDGIAFDDKANIYVSEILRSELWYCRRTEASGRWWPIKRWHRWTTTPALPGTRAPSAPPISASHIRSRSRRTRPSSASGATTCHRPKAQRLTAGIDAPNRGNLLNTLAMITDRKAGFRSLGDTWADTTNSHGRLMLTVLAGLAEFERELIRVRTGEGRDYAKARGVKMGRPFKMTPHQIKEAQRRRDNGEPMRDIARSYNVSHSTISRLAT